MHRVGLDVFGVELDGSRAAPEPAHGPDEAFRAGFPGNGVSDADGEALAELIERCGRLPLALSLMAAKMTDTPVSTILTELRTRRYGLEAFTDVNMDNVLRAVFAWSYDRLTPGAAALFRSLSVHPGPDLTEEAMAAVTSAADMSGT